MKTLGLIGGTTWLSTVDYYKIINRLTNEKLGGGNSAKLLLYSLNFEDLRVLTETNNWEQIGKNLIDIAKNLENAGAECIVLCANTPHLFAHEVQQQIKIPILHIAEATAKEIVKQKIKTVGLLGTKPTMEQPFYKNILLKYGIETIIPDEDSRDFIHKTIFDELGNEIFKEETKIKYLEIINQLQKEGAEGIILGCTEIPMLIKPEDCNIITFDTLKIHAEFAVDFALYEK
jgi:aspartate racemase